MRDPWLYSYGRSDITPKSDVEPLAPAAKTMRCPFSHVRACKRSDDKGSWLKKLLERRHVNIATVALAHKTVRTVWAMLAHDREYCPNYKSLPVAA
jgi:hypothetical protein